MPISIKERIRDRSHVETLFGRRRYVPEIQARNRNEHTDCYCYIRLFFIRCCRLGLFSVTTLDSSLDALRHKRYSSGS